MNLSKMKNLISLFALLLITSFAFESKAQCNAELYTSKSVKQLSEEGYTFVKSFRIDGKAGARKKIEYTIVFSKDSSYNIRVNSQDGNNESASKGIIATLYDNQRTKMTSNFHDNKFYPGWIYKCKATGIYYITFTFKDSTNYCGAAALGMKR